MQLKCTLGHKALIQAEQNPRNPNRKTKLGWIFYNIPFSSITWIKPVTSLEETIAFLEFEFPRDKMTPCKKRQLNKLHYLLLCKGSSALCTTEW